MHEREEMAFSDVVVLLMALGYFADFLWRTLDKRGDTVDHIFKVFPQFCNSLQFAFPKEILEIKIKGI